MAIAAIIPSVWAARFERILARSNVYASRTNTNFEGEVRAYGDTVKIPFFGTRKLTVSDYNEDGTLNATTDRTSTPEEVNAGTLDLLIDKQKQWAFMVEDVERVQSRPDLMDAAMGAAGRTTAESVDDFLRGIFNGAASDVAADAARGVSASKAASRTLQDSTTAVDAANGGFGKAFLKLVAQLKNKMDKANLPQDSRWIIVHPDTIMGVELYFLENNVSGVYQPATSEETLRNGFAGRLLGFDLQVSNNAVPLTTSPFDTNSGYRLFAGQGNEAVTYAQQINTVESYRSHQAFADVVRGLSVYGAKLTHPDRIYMVEHRQA